jgi:hypothetical protein
MNGDVEIVRSDPRQFGGDHGAVLVGVYVDSWKLACPLGGRALKQSVHFTLQTAHVADQRRIAFSIPSISSCRQRLCRGTQPDLQLLIPKTEDVYALAEQPAGQSRRLPDAPHGWRVVSGSRADPAGPPPDPAEPGSRPAGRPGHPGIDRHRPHPAARLPPRSYPVGPAGRLARPPY